MFGWKRGSQAPGGSRDRGEGQGLGNSEQRQLSLAWLVLGHKDSVTWPVGLPLCQPQVSGSQTQEGLSGLFCFKATGAKANYIFNSGRGSTQAHKPNRLLRVCFSDTLETTRFRENSSHMLGPAFPERVQRLLCQHCHTQQAALPV